jgi:Tol biopolymer transport system component
MRKLSLVAAFGLAAFVNAAIAQEADVAAKLDALGRINSVTSPSLSPDGRHLAHLSNASGSRQIWVRDLRTSAAMQRTKLADAIGSVFWSPTADRLAYSVARGGGLNTQAWVMNADGTGARRLTPGGKENNGLVGRATVWR